MNNTHLHEPTAAGIVRVEGGARVRGRIRVVRPRTGHGSADCGREGSVVTSFQGLRSSMGRGLVGEYGRYALGRRVAMGESGAYGAFWRRERTRIDIERLKQPITTNNRNDSPTALRDLAPCLLWIS